MWRQEKAREMREVATAAFAEIGAPFEYPTLPQMEQVKAEIERKYRWDQLEADLQEEHERVCRQLFSKFEEPF